MPIHKGDISVMIQTSPKPPSPNDCYIIGYELLTDHGAQRTLFKYPALKTEYNRALKSAKSAGGDDKTIAANLYYITKPVEELCGFLLSEPLFSVARDPKDAALTEDQLTEQLKESRLRGDAIRWNTLREESLRRDPKFAYRGRTEWALMYDGLRCGSLYHDPVSYPNTPWRAHIDNATPSDTQPTLARRDCLLQAAALMGRKIRGST